MSNDKDGKDLFIGRGETLAIENFSVMINYPLGLQCVLVLCVSLLDHFYSLHENTLCIREKVRYVIL